MKSRVTRAEIAAKAGVSPTTVAYVLGGRDEGGISVATRDRVRAAAEELGYVPNGLARALRTGRSNLVALWMSVLGPSYYGQIVHRVQDLLRRDGYEMLVSDTAPHPDAEAHVARLVQWPVDGVLAFDSAATVCAYRDSGGRPAPVVAMGVDLPPAVDHVRLDLAAGARLAMAHLADLGRPVTFLGDAYATAGDDARFVAYLEDAAARRYAPDVIVPAARTRRAAFEAMTARIRNGPAPRAVFAFNDDLATGALRAALDAGLRVPEDLALVGHDGTEETLYTEPRLTTVHLPTDEMVETAWRLLGERIADPSLPLRRISLTPRLEVRASSLGRSAAPVLTQP